jgi:hypothetical protein
MLAEFVSRGGERMVVEISTEEPCPECCGGLEPVGDPEAPRYYRCNSCGLDFRPVKAGDELKPPMNADKRG